MSQKSVAEWGHFATSSAIRFSSPGSAKPSADPLNPDSAAAMSDVGHDGVHHRMVPDCPLARKFRLGTVRHQTSSTFRASSRFLTLAMVVMLQPRVSLTCRHGMPARNMAAMPSLRFRSSGRPL